MVLLGCFGASVNRQSSLIIRDYDAERHAAAGDIDMHNITCSPPYRSDTLIKAFRRIICKMLLEEKARQQCWTLPSMIYNFDEYKSPYGQHSSFMRA